MCWRVVAKVIEDVPACGCKLEVEILGSATSVEEFRDGAVGAGAGKARA